MGLFSSKTKINGLDYWTDNIDRKIGNSSMWDTYTLFNSLIWKEKTDYSIFSSELLKIRVEIVCMTYQQLYGEMKTFPLDLGLNQYFMKLGQGLIWEDLRKYNIFIADIVAKWVNPDGSANGELKEAKLKFSRFSQFKVFHSNNCDPVINARICNRIQTKGIKNEFLLGSLVNLFIKIVSIDSINLHVIYTAFVGLYNGASQDFKNLEII